MIVVKVSGGLGNQLFAYAAGRSLALRHGVSLIVDASKYASQWSEDSLRPFLLDYFPISARLRHVGPVMENRNILFRAIRRLTEDVWSELVDRDKGEWGYFSAFADVSSRARLCGYFISPRFFSDFEADIRREIQLSPNFLQDHRDRIGESFFSSISSRVTVGVHVRRGDFLNQNGYVNLYLPETEAYYIHAISYFVRLHKDPLFVVASDDLVWSHEFFSNLGVEFVCVPQSRGRFSVMRDFFVLSSTSHQIMANSTFSWWAAWLGNKPGREVLMPPRWDASGVTPVEEMRAFDWKIVDL